jgi:hypothetical protein
VLALVRESNDVLVPLSLSLSVQVTGKVCVFRRGLSIHKTLSLQLIEYSTESTMDGSGKSAMGSKQLN